MNPSATPGPIHSGGDAGAPLLSVRGLRKYFPIRSGGFLSRTVGVIRAVDDVSFDLYPGETLGLVGESGSGKTTAARCILRALAPTAGEVLFRLDGRMVDLARLSARALKPLRPSIQMVFQDPFSSLNPRMTVGQIIAEPLVIHQLAKGAELDRRVTEMLSRIGLKREHGACYPHAFSGGQRQRIGIARALITRPSLMVADEAVSALDVSVQAQVLNLLKDLQEEFKLTYLFVAHNLEIVRHLCSRVAVMYAGRIIELGPTAALFAGPKHPYTRALRSAVPRADPDQPMSLRIAGETADPGDLPAGCAFHPRCPECFAPCRTQRPELAPGAGDHHWVACHLFANNGRLAGAEDGTRTDLRP
jgi:oligopeptide/dipeptide ABC transporter ATP-binding protein